MKKAVVMFCLFSQTVLAVAAAQQPAQPSRVGGRAPATGARAEYEPVFIRLRNTNCNEIAKMLASTFSGCSSYPMERPNSVVFSGPSDLQSEARKLIAEIDGAADGKDEEEGNSPNYVIVSVKHRRVEELVEQLGRMAADGWNLNVSGDRGRSKILLSGNKETVAQAVAMTQKLDTPAEITTVEFAFIQAKAKGAVEGAPMPGDLSDVAKELERFGQLSLLGRLSTVVIEGEKFGVEGHVVPGVHAEIRGMINSSHEGAIKMEIKASLSLNPAKKDVATAVAAGMPYFQVETSISTQCGEYLVLGSAPAGSEVGESAILVMHVKEAAKE